MPVFLYRLLAVTALAVLALPVTAQTTPEAAAKLPRTSLQIVLVLDGLRPDSITPANTPNLNRLRSDGVQFENTHAVFPTVTRVNSASLGTGVYPNRHGIMGNSIYVPAVDPLQAFGNDDYKNLLKLDAATSGRMMTVAGIAEMLQQSGRKMAVVSSGSTGSAILLTPKAASGIGTVINGDFLPGKKVAYPDTLSDLVLQRFGASPIKGGAKDRYDAAVDWSMRVALEYVLPEVKPDVLFIWMTDPDHIQHGIGVGAPDSVAAIHHDDVQIGALLQKLEALGIRDKTNILVVSDHGFAQTVFDINVEKALRDAGLMTGAESGDVVLASSGQSVAVHVRNHDKKRIHAIVEYLQQQPWCGVLFTAAKSGGARHEGQVDGTFSLDMAHLGGHERSPDIVLTFPWTSTPNRYGVSGTEYNMVGGAAVSGAVDSSVGNHGGIGPWTIRNTMLANGPDFKHGAVVRTPTSNVDVTPTLLHLLGMDGSIVQLDGRAITEAFANGPDQEQVAMEIRTLRVHHGSYRAVLQESETAGKRYVDKAWREF